MTQIDHTAYPKSLKGVSVDALEYTIKDAREAIAAMPDGDKAGYYADEISYCSMELARREHLVPSERDQLAQLTDKELVAYQCILASGKRMIQVTDNPDKLKRHGMIVGELLDLRGITY